MSDDTTELWYICVDQCRHIFDATYITVSRALTIAKLKEMISAKHGYTNVDSITFKIHGLPVRATDEGSKGFETKVSDFMNRSQPLAGAKTIDECNFTKDQLLSVELPWTEPVSILYRLVDQVNNTKGGASFVSVARVADLKKRAKDENSNDLRYVDARHLVVWKCKSKLSAETTASHIKGLDFKDATTATQLIDSEGIWNLGLADQEVLIVQMPGILPVSVWYLLVDHQKNTKGGASTVSAGRVVELKRAVKEDSPDDLQHVDAKNLVVWHCKPKVLLTKATDDYIKNLSFEDDTTATQLNDGKAICDLDLDNEEVLIVQMPEKNYTATRNTDTHLASLFGELALDEFHQKRLKVFGDTSKELSPSKAAYVTAFLKQQKNNPIFNGRPARNSAVPVGLYHNAFNTFQARLNHAGVSDIPRADDSIYKEVEPLLQSFAEIYPDESGRSAAVMPLVAELLGQPINIVAQPGVSGDGTITTSLGHFSTFLAILEMKNEIGTGNSDPYHQASLSYRKYWTDKKYEAMAPFCHFPSFLICLAGPCIMIAGAIYLDKFMIEPLTDYIWLGGAPHGHSWVPRAVQLFAALRDGISELKSYYEGLQMTAPLSRFPFITSFDKDGLKMEWEYCSQLYSEKLIYEANLKDNTRVIIKFASTYNQEAHELLAKEGYAPRLYHVSRNLYGGLRMIVMERVPGRMLEDGECLDASQYGELKKALELLHKANIVHGDLRPPNIIITEKKKDIDERVGGEMRRKNHKVMLIDFDDCGKAGVGKYPADLNTDLGWPQGVERESIMQVEHDNAMLKKVTAS